LRPRSGDGNTQTKAKSSRQNPSPVGGKGTSPDARTVASATGKTASGGKRPAATPKPSRASSRASRREGPPATLPEASGSAARAPGAAPGRGLTASQEAACQNAKANATGGREGVSGARAKAPGRRAKVPS
jgi:hypothetical protein